MSQCNYCTFRDMKRRHGAKNLTTEPGFTPSTDKALDRKFRRAFGDGVTVYNKHTGEKLAWFMELTDHCVC